jgi:hypothetical protein
VPRESRILLVAGFLLLFATLGWTTLNRAAPTATPASMFGPLGGALPTVGVVFSPRDCNTLIESLRMWNRPFQNGRARVVGLVHGGGGDAAATRRIVSGVGLAFPVRGADAAGVAQLRQAIGHESGSFVVVLDPRGQLRMAVPLEELSAPAARARLLATLERR